MRHFIIGLGIAAVALIAAGLTELTLSASPGHLLVEPVSRPTVAPTSSPTLKPKSSPIPSPSAQPQAITSSAVHLRSQPSITSTIIANLDAGQVVTLGSYRDNTWQGVSVNGASGYIARSYLNY